ncbi:hypothetical protein MKEN_00873300 [Mycena kentingensis (nom. inval.)]|nr:hypothetical protein MKEN_00873300 [Mycena kentingensis (nom. inval.)]
MLPTSSTTALVSPPKDYADAFASLQSTYGFGGATPSPVAKKTKAATSVTTRNSPKPTPSPSQPSTESKATSKDYQAAFADLQSTYGFGGAVPTPIPRSEPAQSNATPQQSSRFSFTRLFRRLHDDEDSTDS